MRLRHALCLLIPLIGARLTAQTTIGSAPAGVLSFDVPAGLSGMSHPLIPAELAAGSVAACGTSDLTFAPAVGAIGPLLTLGSAYYVEILSGPLAGERLDVDVSATIAAGGGKVVLDLGASSASTLASLDPSLVGAVAAVRAHVTLALIGHCFSPALSGSDDAAAADGVRIHGSNGFTLYYLRADGATWATAGSAIDQRNTVIPPDVSIALDLRAPRRFTQTGLVRVTPFRKNLRVGPQSFASGFPVDCTPAAMDARTDVAQPANLRWTGSNNAAEADGIDIFDVSANSFIRYHLRNDGSTWRRLARGDNLAAAPLLRVDALMILYRNQSNATYRVSPPFSL